MPGTTKTNNNINNNVAIPPILPDNVKRDVAGKMKGFFAVLFSKSLFGNGKKDGGKTGEKVPAYEGQQTEKLYDIKDLTTNVTPIKVIKLVGILLMVVMIAGALYVKFIRKTPLKNDPILVNAPSPTYSPYQKYKPSIYADDPNFKKIDEGLSVLENEVKNTTLEEKSLLPPKLDFDIVFK